MPKACAGAAATHSRRIPPPERTSPDPRVPASCGKAVRGAAAAGALAAVGQGHDPDHVGAGGRQALDRDRGHLAAALRVAALAVDEVVDVDDPPPRRLVDLEAELAPVDALRLGRQPERVRAEPGAAPAAAGAAAAAA